MKGCGGGDLQFQASRGGGWSRVVRAISPKSNDLARESKGYLGITQSRDR